MEFSVLKATSRTSSGKNSSRRVRRVGQIPAVAYGRTLGNLTLAVDPTTLVKILQGPHGLNTVIKLEIEGDAQHKDLLVMVREFSHHPVTRNFLHADFWQVKLEEDITVEVPLVLTGKAAGIVQGGVLRQIYRKLPVRVRPNTIPVNITTDITSLELNHSLKVQDLKLPETVKVSLSPEQSIVSVVAPEKDRGAEETVTAAAQAAKPGEAKAADAKSAAKPADAKPAAKKK